MKLGKRPAREDQRDLRFARYAAPVVLPKVPSRFGFGKILADWGTLGNDLVGDCVPASAAHSTMVYNWAVKRPVSFTTPWVLGDYSAVTGYDPAVPGSDQGTFLTDYLKFRRFTGIADAHGIRHQIAAYVALDPHDFDQLLMATFIFGAVEIGFNFPDTAMWQFNHSEVWSPNAAAAIEGGHCVPVVGTTAKTRRATCVTWGRRQEFTREFYEAYNDESYAVLSLEVLHSDGTGLHGFDLATLRADLAAL